jgi:HEPN domain-containing protein
MPLDPELVDETKAWLVKAEQDLCMADISLAGQRKLPGMATYHAQQAAEKSLKGFLTWHSCTFGKTHNLTALGEPCWIIDASLREVIQRAASLTDYVWKHRYPGDYVDPTHEEAIRVVQLAQVLFSAILARLPNEVDPY